MDLFRLAMWSAIHVITVTGDRSIAIQIVSIGCLDNYEINEKYESKFSETADQKLDMICLRRKKIISWNSVRYACIHVCTRIWCTPVLIHGAHLFIVVVGGLCNTL